MTTNFQTAREVRVGNFSDGYNAPFAGYIAEVRITKGVARHTSDFAPMTTPFPNHA